MGLRDLSSILDLLLGHCVLLPSPPSLNQCPHQGQSAGSPGFCPVLRSLWAFDVQVLSGHSNEVGWLVRRLLQLFLAWALLELMVWSSLQTNSDKEETAVSNWQNLLWERRQMKGH